VPVPAAADADVSRQVMADTMARMMEAMGLFGAGAQGARSMMGGGMPQMPYGMPFPGGGNPMDQYGRMGQEWMGRLSPGGSQGGAGMPAMPWQGSALEGVWEVAGGGLLIVQGERFRLYAPDWSQVEGSIRTSGARLHLTNPEVGFDLDFEYAVDQGRLAMRDASGQLYLYRLVVLGGG
jgi:hypothetical protein